MPAAQKKFPVRRFPMDLRRDSQQIAFSPEDVKSHHARTGGGQIIEAQVFVFQGGKGQPVISGVCEQFICLGVVYVRFQPLHYTVSALKKVAVQPEPNRQSKGQFIFQHKI